MPEDLFGDHGASMLPASTRTTNLPGFIRLTTKLKRV